jgi:protein-disulfide isomerase
MCPYCRRFERDNAADIGRLVEDAAVALIMHPVAILDRLSGGTLYSTRAAAAAYAVAAGSPAHFMAFNTALFADQPPEGSHGLSQAQLEQVAKGQGISQAVAHSFADERFLNQATQATSQAIEAGLQGTPTVLLTGRERQTYQWDGQRPLTEALAALAAD